MATINIDVICGAPADSLLVSDSFAAQWAELQRQCSWATAFQTPDYGRAWYRTYRDRYEPVLLLSPAVDGHLQGLLPLAISQRDGRLVVAGDQQAGYQVWICSPQLAEVFPSEAIHALWQHLPGRQVEFRYLPPETPLAWLNEAGLKRLCLLETHRRPLLRFGDGQELENSLKKGSNRSRLNRLQKIGPMEFKRIIDPAELEARFAEIAPCHDARHVAMNGSSSFRDDPRMKSFALALGKVPDLVHATILTVGGRLASAHLGACSGKEVECGLITHSPWLAKHSPGKFHIYFLAKMLRQEGYEQLDLTPGGGTHYYKERFANAWDEVHTLAVYPTLWKRQTGVLRTAMKATARKTLDLLHLTPNQARQYTRQLKRLRPSLLPAQLRRAATWIGSSGQTRIYRHDLGSVSEPPAGGSRRDSLNDLLAYRPGALDLSRQDFMTAALARMEEGQHVYTCVQEGQLLHWGWLIERPEAALLAKSLPGFSLPGDIAVALDFHTEPSACGSGLGMQCLLAMLSDAASAQGIRQLVVALPAGGDISHDAMLQAGFSCEGTLIERRLGWRRRWSVQRGDMAAASPEPAAAG